MDQANVSEGDREDQPDENGTTGSGSAASQMGSADHYPEWTDDQWHEWNSWRWGWRYDWTRNSPTTWDYYDDHDEQQHSERGSGQDYAQATWWTSSTTSTTRTATPWNDGTGDWGHSSQSDPWTSWSKSQTEDRGPGGSDKIVVPEFDGGDDARSYLRKVQAWKRVTRMRPQKQALLLYNSLTGKAWRDAEEIDVTTLDAANGVEVFIDWITQRYLDKEIVKVGKFMSEFFKTFKRQTNQEIREFNMEFDRHIHKMKEVGCVLPGVCCSWWYVDKLRLDNTAELNLLSSVGNQYDLPKLQEAAVVQDRMTRRLWEGQRNRNDVKKAYMADLDDIPEYDTDVDQDDGFPDTETAPEVDDDETHEAFAAFQNAKAKYNNILKARGTNLTPASKEEALQRAKARSFCSACGRKGHWHKDPVCPKHKETLGRRRHIPRTSSTTRATTPRSWM